MSSEHLKSLREHEIKQLIPYFCIDDCILEIGSGNGWQAEVLKQHGLKVFTLDLAENKNGSQVIYDGEHLPFKSHSVDIVYTSNVLEHIDHIQNFQREMWRVLIPGGHAIHVLPSSSWRWWTSLAFYLRKLQTIPQKLTPPYSFSRKSSYRRQLFPERHGTGGNSLTELYSFSRHYWTNAFSSKEWRIVAIHPNHIFYTGYSLLDQRLSLNIRRYLSYLGGSSCTFYILVKK